jgi:cyanophycinase-like exopeptidase
MTADPPASLGGGAVALHGGGEFLDGDEPFLEAILRLAAEHRGDAGGDGEPVRTVVMPTAAARGRPDLAGGNGVAALGRIAQGLGIRVDAGVLPIVDHRSANDPRLVARLEAADLIHLPGGDPDLLPAILPDTAARDALGRALSRGAVIAGASAGAMALADPCWTPDGLVPGLAFVPGILVVPHADARAWTRRIDRFATMRPTGVGVLGLAERTGIIGRPGGSWQVVGEGEVRWLAGGRPLSEEPVIARHGAILSLDGTDPG